MAIHEIRFGLFLLYGKRRGSSKGNEVAYALLTFRSTRRLTQPLAVTKKKKEEDVSRTVRREFIFFFIPPPPRLPVRVYRVLCACYNISIQFLPRYNFSLLHPVQTECLTKSQMNSSPRLALSAWLRFGKRSTIPAAKPSRWIVSKVNICVSIKS